MQQKTIKTKILLHVNACGASLSVFFDRSAILNGYKNIVVIVCGGSNVDLGMIEAWSKTE